MLLRNFAIAGTLLLSGVAAHAQDTVVTVQQFAARAYEQIRFNIKLSQLSTEKSTNQEIVSLSEKFIGLENKVAKELASTATAEDVKLRSGMSEWHRSVLTNIRSKAGVEFNRMYIKERMKAHDDTVALFSIYARNGREGRLKSFAAQKLPDLERHQERLKQLASEAQ